MFKFDAKLSTAVAAGSEPAPPPQPAPKGPLSAELLDKIQRYWEAANYLTVGQIYLRENPLLREPLRPEHIKPRLLGHWGTSPGQNFIYVHLNRLIRDQGVEMLYIAGPGHGGPALNANSYLEGSYTAVRPEVTENTAGMRILFREFSMPGGVSSHCGPHLPSSIHEGGELGYALLHAYGAAFDNPDLVVACVIGDGEAETCPLEGSWKSNRFLNPATDGAVLPILHLNGYKISSPTIDARTSDEHLGLLLRGQGYKPYFLEGDDPTRLHQEFAATLDACYAEIRSIQKAARVKDAGAHLTSTPCWPVIVLRTPKGWTGPKEVDGLPIEGTFRAHQVPLANVRESQKNLHLLEEWMKSYHPEKHFDSDGRLIAELRELAPKDSLRMGASPHANGGRVLNALSMPEFAEYALEIPAPGSVIAEAPRKTGEFLRDIIKLNPYNFRFFCPDETNSNRLNAVFDVTDRRYLFPTVSIDDHISPEGRVIEVLSEHCCQGWLEGYLLTGRHGLWSSYEAFAQVVDSMLTQHAKWLEESRELPWRKPLASLNVFLTSHAWRNDHNGFSHQAPGFVDNALARRSTVIRTYYPPDANTLLSTVDHCLRTRHYVNVITCGKQEQLQWLTMDEAIRHCSRGASIWKFATNDNGGAPDVILACVGDVPTLEAVAASWLLQKNVPGIRVRLVNIVDLAVLMSPTEHPHGMDSFSFEALFTNSAPVIFAHHGYRWAIHSMIHGRPNEARFHVRGFIDQGSTTTPFDMVVRNKISRYHLAMDALKYIPRLRTETEDVVDEFQRKLIEHNRYIRENFEDMPEISLWRWTNDFSESTAPLPLAKGQPRSQLFTDG
jgi:xylulose-5-phosphate/fructose-6-phosphate phosphoketolase